MKYGGFLSAVCFVSACAALILTLLYVDCFQNDFTRFKNYDIITTPLTIEKMESTVPEKSLPEFIPTRKVTSMTNLQNCSERTVELSPYSLPITGLVSFPGSGNTWTRHLLQQMTGLGTSSCYCDGGLKKGGFPFECYSDKSKTLVVKTHATKHFEAHRFEKVVLLIRNPYEALISRVQFSKSGHIGITSRSVLKEAMKERFDESLAWYITLTSYTTNNFTGPVHVVQYEKLKTDMSDTLWKLAKFLHVNVTQRDIDCTVKLQEGNFHRKTSEEEHLQLLKEVYDKDKLLQMKEAADKTEKLVKEAYGIDIDVGGATERLLEDIKVL